MEVLGLENVPVRGGGILVAWHPNGLVDGLLILTSCPRQVVFGVRHGLFDIPVLRHVLRALGTVPLHRSQDNGAHTSDQERREANRQSLAGMGAAARHSFVAIFPEGVTHDEPTPLQLRYGAARLFFLAAESADNDESAGNAAPIILPVGLHYDKKHAFRSRALVAFHPPIELPAELAATGEQGKEAQETERVATLTALIEHTLNDVVHATESWELHDAMHQIRELVRAERAARTGAALDPSGMAEREMGFARVWQGYASRRESHPEETTRLMKRVRHYAEIMRILGIEEKDLDPHSRRRARGQALLLLLEAVAVFVLLPPLVLFGYAVNVPIALLSKYIAKNMSKTRKEQAGLKIMVGTLAFPLTWLAVSVVVGWYVPSLWPARSWMPEAPSTRAALTFALCALSGGLALRYHHLAGELARTLRGLFAGSLHLDAIKRMRQRRSKLYDEVMELREGIDS